MPKKPELFAVGAGGNPERHITLLEALSESGCTVVAPHFERLSSLVPTEADLTLRAKRLRLALDIYTQSSASAIVGIGHSIGVATLIALSGGKMWLGPGRRVNISTDTWLSRLGLLSPPTKFFQAPGALDAVHVPIQVWRTFVREKYGTDPTVTYFESPVEVDNVTQKILADE